MNNTMSLVNYYRLVIKILIAYKMMFLFFFSNYILLSISDEDRALYSVGQPKVTWRRHCLHGVFRNENIRRFLC
jgi:hypothetical protein